MTKYEIIYEELQNRVNEGLLTLEDAELINDMAYEKYVNESKDESKDLELIDQLRSLIENGKVKLDKDIIKCIKELIEDSEENESDEDDSDDNADEDNEEEAKPEEDQKNEEENKDK